MKRKDFIKYGVLGSIAGSSLGACHSDESQNISAPNIISDKRYKWKMVTTWPPNFPVVHEGCMLIRELINTMSGGRIEIDIYGGGELVPPLEVFDAVSSGAVEMGHGAAYYWSGIEAAFPFFTSVPFGMNAQQYEAWIHGDQGMDLWTELYSKYNLVPFLAGNTGVQMGGWYNKKIDTIDDFKGLKIRMPGLGGLVIEKAGGTAVLSPGSELYTNLERGVIDATEWIGPYHDYLMGFHQIAKYYYYPGWHETGSGLECIVNKRDFDGLSQDLQEIVRTAMFRVNSYMKAQFESKNNGYLKKIKEESEVEILPFSEEILTKLREHAMEMYDDLATKDPIAKRVFESFWSFRNDIKEWSTLTEKIFHNSVQ